MPKGWQNFTKKLKTKGTIFCISKRLIGDKTLKGSYSVAERLHNQAVIVKDLSVKELLEKGNLSRQIADAAWRRFISFLEYKAKWYGRVLIKVNRYFPSSKLCSVCGYKKEVLKLSDRK